MCVKLIGVLVVVLVQSFNLSQCVAVESEEHITNLVERILAEKTFALTNKVRALETMVENQQTRINYLEKREKWNERIILDMEKTLTEIRAELNSSRFDSFEENADRALNYHLDEYAHKAEKAEPDSGRNSSVVPEEITKRTSKRESEKDRDIVQSRQRRVPEIVAFTAYLSHKIDHMAVGHHIVFDKILTNDGAGYNSYTGIFTVPVTGLYLFTYSVNDHYKKSMLQLVVDGSNIVDIIVDPDSDTEEAMSGNTAIIHVSQGQSVWIQEYEANDASIFATPIFRYCTFSGVLLH